MGDCFKSAGTTITETREISPFDSLKAYDNVNVYILIDSVYDVKVEAGDHLQSLIKAEVINNCLSLRNNNKCNWVRSYKKEINVYVSVPKIHWISSYGAGTIKGLNTIKQDELYLWIDSSGDMEMEVDVKELYSVLSAASGNLSLKGKAVQNNIFYDAVSIVNAYPLETEKTFIDAKGTGDMKVWAKSELGANIHWKGNIYYKGNPDIVYYNKSNTGALIPQ